MAQHMAAGLLRDDPEALDLFDRAMMGKHGGDRKSTKAIKPDNVRVDPEWGNARQYALRRLRAAQWGRPPVLDITSRLDSIASTWPRRASVT